MNKFTQPPPNLKSKITRYLLELLPEEKQCSHQVAMNTWWHNIRKTGGLRLTDQGYEILNDELEFESWSVDISSTQKTAIQKIFLGLEKNLNWPYYIHRKNKQIYFFCSREATVATLYGDVQEWLSKN